MTFKNTNKKHKTTTLKTLLILSIAFMMLVPGGIIPVHAVPGDLLLTINNPTPADYDRFGVSVATTSTDNMLIGAYGDDTGANDAGSAYLFDGDDGSLLLTINNPAPADYDWFGVSVATTSTDNILVGAIGDDTGANDAGSAYLFDGDDGSLLLTINNPAPADYDYFGISVATTSTGDILVGAYFDDTGATNAGSAYLFDGDDGSLLLTINNPTPVEDDRFGITVATTSTGDILVGAIGYDTGVGSAYLFDGYDGSLLLTINNPTPAPNDYFGISVTATSTDNILVGAYSDDTGANGAGSAYLFDGYDGSLLLTINNPTPVEDDRFGITVATTSTDNILIGAIGDDTGAGSVYLFDGDDGSLLLTINNPAPVEDDYFGVSVTATSTDNILIGAYGDDTGATNTGSVYLFDGISASTPAPIITSLIANDPDDLDNVYFVWDTITITFDSDTNTPGGTDVQRTAAVDDLFTFTESLGKAYSGQWIAPDTFIITIRSSIGAGPPIINDTTVIPAGITLVLSADETSEPSTVASPVLSGDFGITP